MPAPKPLSKQDILRAMANTRSNRAAARYLNCSYWHYKKWAKLYEATEPEYESLFHQHLNPSGKGIPKFLGGKHDPIDIKALVEGDIKLTTSFSIEKIKYKLTSEGYLEEKCNKCGFCERRVLDYKTPLLLNFKDGNKENFKLENLEFLCYNCYYLSIGDVFDNKQLKGIEDHVPSYNSEVDWEIDDYTKQRLEELGLNDDEDDDDEDDGSDLISYL